MTLGQKVVRAGAFWANEWGQGVIVGLGNGGLTIKTDVWAAATKDGRRLVELSAFHSQCVWKPGQKAWSVFAVGLAAMVNDYDTAYARADKVLSMAQAPHLLVPGTAIRIEFLGRWKTGFLKQRMSGGWTCTLASALGDPHDHLVSDAVLHYDPSLKGWIADYSAPNQLLGSS